MLLQVVDGKLLVFPSFSQDLAGVSRLLQLSLGRCHQMNAIFLAVWLVEARVALAGSRRYYNIILEIFDSLIEDEVLKPKIFG